MSGGFGSSTQSDRRITELERKVRGLSAPASSAGTIAGLGTFSLTADGAATSTTVTDTNVTASSFIWTAPTNDGALSLEGAILCTAGSGSFSVSHAASTVARSYVYAVINPA